jgi:hypothetical protein
VRQSLSTVKLSPVSLLHEMGIAAWRSQAATRVLSTGKFVNLLERRAYLRRRTGRKSSNRTTMGSHCRYLKPRPLSVQFE